MDQTQEQLTQVMGKLEEKEKALQNVSFTFFKQFLLPNIQHSVQLLYNAEINRLYEKLMSLYSVLLPFFLQ